MFQAPEPPLDERPLDFDIMLGQLYRRVHDAFYATHRLKRFANDVRSPKEAGDVENSTAFIASSHHQRRDL